VEHAPAQRLDFAVRCRGDGLVQDGLETRELPLALDECHRALLLGGQLGVPVQRRRGDVDEREFAYQVGCYRADPDRGQSAQRHAHDEIGIRCEFSEYRRDGVGVVPRRVVAVLTPAGMAVTGQVHGQRRLTKANDDGVPGVCVLAAAVQKHDPRGSGAPTQRADSAVRRVGFDPLYLRQRTRNTGLLRILGQQ
jgi:hypothetical protein